jgi:hypothetical protein
MSVQRSALSFRGNALVVRQLPLSKLPPRERRAGRRLDHGKSRGARRPDTIDITTASLDYPDDYPPTEEVWLEHRLTWQPTSPDTKKSEAFSSD